MNSTTIDVRNRAAPLNVHDDNSFQIQQAKRVLHQPLQPFFKAVNGTPLQVTKAIWSITPALQAVGLVNERIGKLAKALYGVCWSVVYSCYRPWAYNRQSLPEQSGDKKPTEFDRMKYDLNEHFRLVMGSAVSAVYGGGALGMLYSWLKGDDDLFDSSANVYQTGMFNQNQIFDSMNYAEVLKRKFIDTEKDPETLKPHERSDTNAKAKLEKIDSYLFLPNIAVRAMDTFRLFGKEFSDGTQRIINSLSYVGYGTWAARFGILKQTEDKEVKRGGGLLDEVNSKLEGTALKAEQLLHGTQNYGGKAFYTLLPGLSWIAAGTELIGLREVAEQAFKLEGILERLNPAIASWCIRSTWLKLFEKKAENEIQTSTAA